MKAPKALAIKAIMKVAREGEKGKEIAPEGFFLGFLGLQGELANRTVKKKES